MTGFNAGHSSFNYLTARQDVRVHSFDIGSNVYARPMISYLQRKFPGRLNVTLGDSRTTLLQYLQSTRPLICDMILVDGGHSVEVALADIRNFALLASQPHNVMIVDDMNYPAVATAWKIALRSGIVEEVYLCAYDRQYVVGIVSRHETWYSIDQSKSLEDNYGLCMSPNLFCVVQVSRILCIVHIVIAPHWRPTSNAPNVLVSSVSGISK